jgi:glyoxalase superfamily protein
VAVRWVTGFLDSPSRGAEGFWSAVTGSGLSARRGPGGEFATLVPAGGDAYLRVQVVGDGPARCHLDLHVDDVRGSVSEVVARGASVRHDEGDLVVLGSPAGLAFCLVRWDGEAVRPGPGVHGGLVDRVRVEVPSGVVDAEADFWAAATGWLRRPGSDGLLDPTAPVLLAAPVLPAAGMPLSLLVQGAGDGRAGMYLDVSAADRGAEVGRHVALGAVVVRETAGWTALRDPVGREYRVTDAD